MENSLRRANSRSVSQYQFHWQVDFEVEMEVPFGKAVHLCGSLPEFGSWQPLHAVRLGWHEGHRWSATVAIPKDIPKAAEFKFIISDWLITQSSNIEWEGGKSNRSLDLYSLKPHSRYQAVWNRHRVVLCLHSHFDRDCCDFMFVSGSVEELGLWKEKRLMQPIEEEMKDSLVQYFRSHPEFMCEPELEAFHTFAFTLDNAVECFNYVYIRSGEGLQSEVHPGRTVVLGERHQEAGRIMELEWAGERIILDESSFDHLILEKMTNQIFIASYLKNSTQFCKILDRHITAILNLNSKDEDYTISNYHLKTLCQQNNILLKNWTVEELSSRHFLTEAEQIVAILEKLLVEGHRVCIHCSRRIMRSAPIHVLYLTLFVGYSLGEAIEQMGRENPLSESGCKVVQDVFNLVHNKMNRGKISISTH